jgi:polysaccharide pyruvyl transferase WcaK-like protein
MAPTLAFINPRLTTKNVGDLFIEESAKRVLSYNRAASFDVDPRLPIRRDDIERINRADAAVILGTNLWYRCLPKPTRWQFRLDDLQRIRTPIIPFGVGTTRHGGEDNGFEPETREQLRVIHASCRLASARDPRTAEALAEAGIHNVAVTGCPTMFHTLRPAWELRRRTDTRQIVLTVRRGQKQNLPALLRLVRRRGLQAVVAAQRDADRFLARPSLFFRNAVLRHAVPTIFGFELEPYLRLIETSCGALGWRLHGTMLHLAHGSPALLLADSSRSASFCEMFGLPIVHSPDHVRLDDTTMSDLLDRFFDDATFALLAKRYRPLRAEMIRLLEANGLQHNLGATPEQAAA